MSYIVSLPNYIQISRHSQTRTVKKYVSVLCYIPHKDTVSHLEINKVAADGFQAR